MRMRTWMGAALAAFLADTRAETPGNGALAAEVDSLKGTIARLEARLAQADPGPAREARGEGGSAGGSADSAVPEPEPPATRADVEGLRTDLENYKYEVQRSRETKTALSTRAVTLGGTVAARASAISPQANTGTTAVAAPRSTSYDIPSASLNFSGNLYRDYTEGKNLDFRVQLAYSRNSPANDNSQFNLQDAWVRYNVFETNGLDVPRLNVTVGQQQTAFGLEAQTGEELRPVINSAQFLAGTNVGRRNVGLVVRGDLLPYVDYGFNYRAPLLEYALGITTGSGPNKADDNDAKDWFARAAVTLPVDYHSFLRELKFGASYYSGERNLTRTTGTGAAAVTSVVDNAAGADRIGFDIYYNHNPFGATYEYVRAEDQVWVAARSAKGRTEGQGHVATLFFTLGEQWVRATRGKAKYDDWWPQSFQTFARYDHWEPNESLEDDQTTIYTVGFNWFFAETSKFQVNYNFYDYELESRRNGRELLAQLQFGF